MNKQYENDLTNIKIPGNFIIYKYIYYYKAYYQNIQIFHGLV